MFGDQGSSKHKNIDMQYMIINSLDIFEIFQNLRNIS